MRFFGNLEISNWRQSLEASRKRKNAMEPQKPLRNLKSLFRSLFGTSKNQYLYFKTKNLLYQIIKRNFFLMLFSNFHFGDLIMTFSGFFGRLFQVDVFESMLRLGEN